MREMNENWLDDVCRISNVYNITPKKVINIYNKVHDKPYFSTVKQGIAITERYIKMNYSLRKNSLNYQYEEYIEFMKQKQRDIL